MSQANNRAEARVAAVQATKAIGDVIRELGSVPSGHLYAQLMGRVSFEFYMTAIKALKDIKVVREENHLLIWIGPPAPQQPNG